ncbi:MAG: preprotein translocase subunit SecE [Myxococcota bacterium]|nr:preprotein translocase subunit SecE [Myxococcales bacterium]
MAESGSGSGPGRWVHDAREYLNDVQAEAKKITWPAQKEAIAGAVGVVVISAAFAAFLAIVDLGLGFLLRLVLG